VDEPCITCLEIELAEITLDGRADALARRVRMLCAPVRAENELRWERFAKRCRGFFGRRFQRRHLAPELLPEPDYFEEAWYREEGKAIEAEARRIEEMKRAHPEHWGDEVVYVDDGDPHGPAVYQARLRCYADGHRPFIPDKYDFSSAAGNGKFDVGRRVMCATTLEIVELNDCRWSIGPHTRRRPVYWRRAASRPDFLPRRSSF